MLSSRSIEWDDSHLFVLGFANDMVEVRDGQVYFTLDDSDITEYCSFSNNAFYNHSHHSHRT